MEDSDPNRLRDAEVKRLAEMVEMAYTYARDPELSITMRESWHRQYTNSVLALNQLLKDSQIKEYARKLEAILEDEKEEDRR